MGFGAENEDFWLKIRESRIEKGKFLLKHHKSGEKLIKIIRKLKFCFGGLENPSDEKLVPEGISVGFYQFFSVFRFFRLKKIEYL